MGLFNSIGNFLKNNPVGKVVTKVMDTATIAFVHPIKTATAIVSSKSTLKDVAQEHFSQPLLKQNIEAVVSAVSYGTAVLGSVGVASKGIIPVAKMLIPATIKGKVIAGVTAPIVLGAVLSAPAKTLGAIANTPNALANFGGNIGTFAADPSLSNAKSIIQENPLIAGGLVATAVVLGAKTLIPAITTGRQIDAINEQTEAINSASAVMVGGGAGLENERIVNTNEGKPILPQTQVVTPTKNRATASRKRKKPVANGNISQRVNVIVTDNEEKHKYLNRHKHIK